MKKILINQKEYYYKIKQVFEDDGSDDHEDSEYEFHTYFYIKDGTKWVRSKSFLLIPYGAKDKEIDNYIYQFDINFDIEDSDYSKEEVRTAIEKKLNKISREEEISKGIII